MVHQRLLSAAGCVLAIALTMGGGVAGAQELQLASLTTQAPASARGSDRDQAPQSADLGEAQAGAQDATPEKAPQDAKGDRRQATAKTFKHKACVHGEWVSPTDFNPFTLSCTVVGF